MIGVTGHEAGTHATHLAPGTVHLEFRAARERQHQLVVVVRVFVGLIIEAKQTGVEHGGVPEVSGHSTGGRVLFTAAAKGAGDDSY
ncbi:hypothetical protein STUTZSP0542_27460 [Stutzerimonas marianensis]